MRPLRFWLVLYSLAFTVSLVGMEKKESTSATKILKQNYEDLQPWYETSSSSEESDDLFQFQEMQDSTAIMHQDPQQLDSLDSSNSEEEPDEQEKKLVDILLALAEPLLSQQSSQVPIDQAYTFEVDEENGTPQLLTQKETLTSIIKSGLKRLTRYQETGVVMGQGSTERVYDALETVPWDTPFPKLLTIERSEDMHGLPFYSLIDKLSFTYAKKTVEYFENNYIGIPQAGALRYCDVNMPINRKAINHYVDQLVEYHRHNEPALQRALKTYPALKRAYDQREDVKKIQSPQDLLDSYQEFKKHFSIEDAIEKYLPSMPNEEASSFAKKLKDHHLAQCASQLEPKMFEHNQWAYLEEKIEKIVSNKELMKGLPLHVQDYLRKRCALAPVETRQAQVIKGHLKKYCEKPNELLHDKEFVRNIYDLYSNPRCSFRTFPLDEDLIDKLADTVAEQISSRMQVYKQAKGDVLSSLLKLDNLTHMLTQHNKAFEYKLKRKANESYESLKKEIREFCLAQKELSQADFQVIEERFKIRPALIAPLPSEEQQEFQQQTITFLKEWVKTPQLQGYEALAQPLVEWSLKLNEENRVTEAEEVQQGAHFIKDSLLGAFDATLNYSRELAEGAITGFGMHHLVAHASKLAPFAKFLGTFSLPGKILSTAYNLCKYKERLVEDFSSMFSAVMDGKYYDIGKFAVRIGLDLADAVFMYRSVRSLATSVNADIKKNMQSFVQESIKDAKNTQLIQQESKKLALEYSKSKSCKHAKRLAKQAGVSEVHFDKRLANVCAITGNQDDAHKLMMLIQGTSSEFKNIKVPGLKKPLNFDWDHILSLKVDKRGNIGGLHFDLNGMIERAEKVKFITLDQAPNGWYRSNIFYGRGSKFSTFFPKELSFKETIKNVIGKMQQVDFSKNKAYEKGKILVEIPMENGKVCLFINVSTNTVTSMYPWYNDWSKHEKK